MRRGLAHPARRAPFRGFASIIGIGGHLHPGGIRTELLRYTTPEMLREMAAEASVQADGTAGEPPVIKTVEQGAATTVWAAFVAPAEDVGGRYCEDCDVAETTRAGHAGVRPYALDPQRAKALWAKSEEMARERFPSPEAA